MMLREYPFDAGPVILNAAEGPPNGPPLLLLHGGSSRWQALAPIVPDLVARWQVHALDFRGHGASGWTPGRYRLLDYVADVEAFLDRRLAEPAVLFGHSLGGAVALLTAVRHARTVRAVVVEDSPLSLDLMRERAERNRTHMLALREFAGSGRAAADLAVALREVPMVVPGQEAPLRAADALGVDSPWFADIAECLRTHDSAVFTALLDEFDVTFAGWDLDAVLPAIFCPVLMLQGDPAHGALLTDEEVTRAEELLPHVTHVQIAGVGHGPHRQRPEEVVRAVQDFLDAI